MARGEACGAKPAGILGLVEWEDEGLDDEPGSPLLPPDDRLWRHPSEAAGAPATAVSGALAHSTVGGAPRVVTVIALTSCISVLLTIGVVAVVRPFRLRVPTQPTAATTDVAKLTALVRPAIAQVVARRAAAESTSASGVVFRADGMVLTTHHVIDGAESVRVVFDDGRDLPARVVGTDADTDLAVLDVEGEGFPVASMAAHRSLTRVGEPAVTIGAGPVVRLSMVSGLSQEAGVEGRRLVDMIRTDGAMANGCSGGAVVDRTGTVIGIAVSNLTTLEGPIGYATPIDVAKAVADELVGSGRIARSWLGIDGETDDAGAVVRKVREGSPAEAAGLAAGDVIVAIDGAAIASMADVVVHLRRQRPGDVIGLRVFRAGQPVDAVATLVEKPA